ncbi:Uncharacterized protein conserved in bacteria (DUF2066) [Ectopseudomonas oleovorans]|uniref:Uncharacterized protein conserved in bacteria (DUF2066) n=1 Tax=Ectopseudomonas oleovorans TaxID=301 RepID=A0A379KA12_ECTOL|nr:DUF2066 domain-containing protein [Pseudomonas oleovorans]SUD60961.1 Uncharacterized protein conserved in bacteria (DUF2066) [Pseudomonas oleovorans]
MRLPIRLLFVCLSLLSLPALAAPVAGLYQVREPVADQQPESRDAAMQKALQTLVLRLTGDAKALQSAGLEGLRKDPQQIVSQYGYEGDALLVEFDPASTDQQLRQAGLALWGANRPAILVWWLNEAPEGSQLVGESQSASALLREAAQHRGLPLRLPLADLSEQALGNADVLLANDPQALREASERYGADALLAVQAAESGGTWQATWRLWLGDEREQGKAEGADQAALADAVLLAVAERLAPRFVVKPGAAQSLTLVIEGADLGRFAALERLLEPFAARLQEIDGQRLVYQVSASPEQLRAQLALGQLQEVSEPLDAAAPPENPQEGATEAPQVKPRTDQLRFRW